MRNRNLDDPWELPDVPAFLTDVARRIDLRADLDVLVVVDDSDVRRVIGLDELPRPADPEMSASELAHAILRKPMERLCPGLEAPRPPKCTAHILRCREGRTVPARDDLRWAYGLLYSMNLLTVYCGDVVVLTPYGWRVAGRAGVTPTLSSLGSRGLRAVALPEGA